MLKKLHMHFTFSNQLPNHQVGNIRCQKHGAKLSMGSVALENYLNAWYETSHFV